MVASPADVSEQALPLPRVSDNSVGGQFLALHTFVQG